MTTPTKSAFHAAARDYWRVIALPGYSGNAQRVLEYLSENQDRSGRVFRSHARIADGVRCSRRTVVRLMRGLVALGLVNQSAPRYRDGERLPNVYTLELPVQIRRLWALGLTTARKVAKSIRNAVSERTGRKTKTAAEYLAAHPDHFERSRGSP